MQPCWEVLRSRGLCLPSFLCVFLSYPSTFCHGIMHQESLHHILSQGGCHAIDFTPSRTRTTYISFPYKLPGPQLSVTATQNELRDHQLFTTLHSWAHSDTLLSQKKPLAILSRSHTIPKHCDKMKQFQTLHQGKKRHSCVQITWLILAKSIVDMTFCNRPEMWIILYMYIFSTAGESHRSLKSGASLHGEGADNGFYINEVILWLSLSN